MAQRLVALQRATRASEQPKPFVEAIADLGRAECAHARCRKLDRQWNAFESAAYLGDCFTLAAAVEIRGNRPCTINEQASRRGLQVVANAERRHRPIAFAV